METMMICPKTEQLVDAEKCIALKNLTKTTAEYFSVHVCKTVPGCPKEDYCTVFKSGWEAVSNLFSRILQ
jgi:hypothetical protein